MKKAVWLTLVTLLLVLPTAGCGGGGGAGNPTVVVNVNATNPGAPVPIQFVTNSECLKCHEFLPSNQIQAGQKLDTDPLSPVQLASSTTIGDAYRKSVHNTPPQAPNATDFLNSEDCHGPGVGHFGLGTIPVYNPGINDCAKCHTTNELSPQLFAQTAHGNPNSLPDAFFFQNGVGTQQATFFDNSKLTKQDGSPVTVNEYIEECSVCHSYSTKLADIGAGDVPTPPQVNCASCHDSHRPADVVRNQVATRDDVFPGLVLNFKPQRIQPEEGLSFFAALDPNNGTWIRPRLHFDFNVGGDPAKTHPGYAKQFTQGDHLRLTPDRLCAACHTRTKYKYSAKAGNNPIESTHQSDVFTQFRNSGHGNKHAPPWEEFSLLSPMSPDGKTNGHRPNYPFDMGVDDGGKSAGLNNSDNVFQCFQCHHGIEIDAIVKYTRSLVRK